MSMIGSAGAKVAELAAAVVTNNVRVEHMTRRVDSLEAEVRSDVKGLIEKMHQMQLEHVREREALLTHIRLVEGRLNALSEQALHAVVEKVAREVMATNGDGHPQLTAGHAAHAETIAVGIMRSLPGRGDVGGEAASG